MKPVVIDFETFAIERRPDFPPKPVGVSIKYPGEKAHYYAFGHPTGNNCAKISAEKALRKAWNYSGGLLFHNAKFDVDVAVTHMGMDEPNWNQIHDTMFLLFLSDPHASTFALKPSAERILKMPSEERDAVKDWLVANGVVSKASKGWGAFIAYAPGDLVGKYADGDVIRTEKLFTKLYAEIKKRKMLPAYDRERQLMPILLENERRGVPVSTRLVADVESYRQVVKKLDGWICRTLKAKDLPIDSGVQLLGALQDAKKVDTSRLGLTPTGAYKTDKESLADAITDKTLAAALNYRASLLTCLGTFMEPWLEQARRSNGRIFTSWNQVRGGSSQKSSGAVTGRLSSSPNFQNIPKEFKPFWAHEAKGLPRAPFPLPSLPKVRSYLIPEPGCALIGRDYSQQELRVLAHYAGGDLLTAYTEDPKLDMHQHAQAVISEMLGREVPRGEIKTTGFGLIYGMGVGLLAKKTGATVDAARQIKNTYLAAFPGIKDLMQEMRRRAAENLPIRTWGGREYYCEPPALINGEIRTFDYKMVNVLVQGSSADCTKQAIIEYHATKPPSHHLLITVHDELLASVPVGEVDAGHAALRRAMASVNFDVAMLSDGKSSTTNWAEMQRYDD